MLRKITISDRIISKHSKVRNKVTKLQSEVRKLSCRIVRGGEILLERRLN